MKQAVSHLDDVVREWISVDQIPEVEWSRMRALEFQEALRSRNELAKQLDGKRCLECTQFKDHVSLINLLCVKISSKLFYTLLFSMPSSMARCSYGRISSSLN